MKSGIDLSPASVQSFVASLQGAAMRVTDASLSGMDSAASRLYERTQASVPRVTGALASSGKVSNQDSGSVLHRIIGYGDKTTNPRTGRATEDYAVRVHEIFHPAHPNSFKWLERTVQQYGSEAFIRELATAIRRAL